ncbi:hypothetical protein HanPSC8_Chr13g0565541 [Helianthus annuus]|nr:hypothetical protein HanPSC8_Chr13g0565541 [Helianthus annuus]
MMARPRHPLKIEGSMATAHSTHVPEFNETEFSVLRCSKDVVMLSDRLWSHLKGALFPRCI